MNSNTTAASLAADLVPLSVTHPYTARGRAPSPEPDGLSAVAFFPGLGSRAAYRNIDMDTVASSAAATEIY